MAKHFFHDIETRENSARKSKLSVRIVCLASKINRIR